MENKPNFDPGFLLLVSNKPTEDLYDFKAMLFALKFSMANNLEVA